jgi:trans-2,3-dihydro-3-hydroxyanthranilate isomerase
VYYDNFIDHHGGCMLLCFAPETVDDTHDLHVRVFADYSDVPEDPATGSSNRCLAAYLVEHEFLDTESIDVTVEQGLPC